MHKLVVAIVTLLLTTCNLPQVQIIVESASTATPPALTMTATNTVQSTRRAESMATTAPSPTPAQQIIQADLYDHLPQIIISTEANLVASPLHTGSSLLLEPLAPSSRIPVIGRDRDGAWLLVLQDNILGWVPTFYSSSGIANYDLSEIPSQGGAGCARYVTAVTDPAAMPVPIQGDAWVEVLIFRPYPEARPSRPTVAVKISGPGRVVDSETDTIILNTGGEVIQLTATLERLAGNSRIHFDLGELESEPLAFQAAFFDTDCSGDVAAGPGAPAATESKNVAGSPGEESGVSALATPVQATSTPIRIISATPTRRSSGRGQNWILLGESVEGRPIDALRIGSGPNVIVLIGGIHSAYAPGSVQVVEQAAAHFQDHPELVPESASLYIIPLMNPDSRGDAGYLPGRLNARGVDLNRNWDCQWEQDPEIDGDVVRNAGGSRVFSEPETQAIKTFLEEQEPMAVIVYTGRATRGLVLPGGCPAPSQASINLMHAYAGAANYRWGYSSSTDSVIPGDITNWLDDQGIPAIFVLLQSFQNSHWVYNQPAIESILRRYGGG